MNIQTMRDHRRAARAKQSDPVSIQPGTVMDTAKRIMAMDAKVQRWGSLPGVKRL